MTDRTILGIALLFTVAALVLDDAVGRGGGNVAATLGTLAIALAGALAGVSRTKNDKGGGDTQ